jgi:hypothetical protein
VSKNPITGTLGCCARAGIDQAAAALPRIVMSSRRLTVLLSFSTRYHSSEIRAAVCRTANLATDDRFGSKSANSAKWVNVRFSLDNVHRDFVVHARLLPHAPQ